MGDLQLMTSAMCLAQFGIYTVNGWNLDVQASIVRHLYTNGTATIEGSLGQFPEAGLFQTTNDLPAANAALESAINCYLEASEFIRNRATTELRLFNLDPAESEAEATFRQSLGELQASLTSPVVWSFNTNYTFFARRLFESPSSPRSLLPDFLENDVIAGTLPNATLGGLMPGLTS